VSLKQGAGRLIRTETDHGLLVICDPRLRQMGYGRRLLAALPPMGRGRRAAGAGLAGRCWLACTGDRRGYQKLPPGLSLGRAGTREKAAVREVGAQHALGAVAQRLQLQLVVAAHHDVQRLLDGRRLLELGHRLLGAVGRGHVGAAVEVVARHVHFVGGQRVDDVVHAQPASAA
jgi:hypothetical protein